MDARDKPAHDVAGRPYRDTARVASPGVLCNHDCTPYARGRSMDRAAQIGVLKKLLHYIDTKTTAMADAPWHNEVTAYTCPERHKREEELLIRQRPLVMGLSCDWPKRSEARRVGKVRG